MNKYLHAHNIMTELSDIFMADELDIHHISMGDWMDLQRECYIIVEEGFNKAQKLDEVQEELGEFCTAYRCASTCDECSGKHQPSDTYDCGHDHLMIPLMKIFPPTERVGKWKD